MHGQSSSFSLRIVAQFLRFPTTANYATTLSQVLHENLFRVRNDHSTSLTVTVGVIVDLALPLSLIPRIPRAER